MTDLYTQLVNNPVGKLIASNVGLPRPVPLERHTPGAPVLTGRALLGGAPGGRLVPEIAKVLALAEVATSTSLRTDLREAAAAADLDAAVFNPEAPDDQRFKALVYDATGITSSTALAELHAFFHPTIRRVQPSGRVVVLGTPPEQADTPKEAAAQRALEGFVRSVGKELRGGATAHLVQVDRGAEGQLASTLRFTLSPKSAYVDAQVIRVSHGAKVPTKLDWEQPLAGRVALVTGASRGIGAAIAEVLARDGAHVVGLDVPALGDDLRDVMEELGGSALELDITAEDAPEQVVAYLEKEHAGVDVVVHNAGITRDKTLGRMDEDKWGLVLAINLTAEERIDDALLEAGTIRAGGRIVCVSSMNGIAGAAGQTNYATSKAGVIGMVEAMAPVVAERGLTINAVAPGFIETAMTAAMPIGPREAGRRMNSVSQGGLPVDVAETIAWFASPASTGLNGNVVRVCGQSLLGA
ncbi:MAG: short-chain dehydrogenase/reductase [Solirubrobacterales bacterium]|nr:short-chain dehydrogenase/reductase [Solirubrobacterales bacterium]